MIMKMKLHRFLLCISFDMLLKPCERLCSRDASHLPLAKHNGGARSSNTRPYTYENVRVKCLVKRLERLFRKNERNERKKESAICGTKASFARLMLQGWRCIGWVCACRL